MPEQAQVESPILSGGISTQPPHLQHPSQVDGADNVAFSVAHGASKRPGTRFITEVGGVRIYINAGGTQTGSYSGYSIGQTLKQYAATWGTGGTTATGTIIAKVENIGTGPPTGFWLTVNVVSGTWADNKPTGVDNSNHGVGDLMSYWPAGSTLRMQPLYRDSIEKYLLVYGPTGSGYGLPRIFPTSGSEGGVIYETANKTYLSYKDGTNYATATDFRNVTVGDTTYIANVNKALAGNNDKDLTAATPVGILHDGWLDPDTMPVKMTRTSVAGTGTTLIFTFAKESWTYRSNAGSDPSSTTANVLPTSWSSGYKIADMVLHRDRLALATKNRIIFSQAGDYTNFWRDDKDLVADSDPVDVSLPGPTPVQVDRVVPFRKSLLVFTKSPLQFEFSTPEALTPSTGAFTPATAYSTIAIQPAALGSFVAFAANGISSGQIFRYAYDDIQVANVAEELTQHIQGHIPTTITRIVGSANDGLIAVLTSTSATTVYVYQEYYANRQAVQRAWTDWTFAQFSRICDIAIMDGVLYVLGESANTSGQYFIEGMALRTSLATGETIAPSGQTTGSSDATDFPST